MIPNLGFINHDQRLNVKFENTTVVDKDLTKKYIPQRFTLELSAAWEGSGPYTQAVTLTGYELTENTKVDLECSGEVLNALSANGTWAIYIENNDGVLTAYAIGSKPAAAITVQATVYETNTKEG